MQKSVSLKYYPVSSPPGVHGYLAHKKTPPPQDPTVGLCLGPYGGPRGWAFSYERGTPVGASKQQEPAPRCGTLAQVSVFVVGLILFIKSSKQVLT